MKPIQGRQLAALPPVFFGGNADIIAMETSRISVDVRDGLAAMSRNGFNPWAFHVIGEMLR